MGKGDKGYRIGFPTPDTYYQSSLADSATVARTITKDNEIITLDELGQGTTLNLTINADIEIGAEIFLKSSCGSTAYDITLGTGTDAATITGVANKTQLAILKYNGSQYDLFNVFQDNQMATTSEDVGVANTGTTAAEYGDKHYHITILTVDTTIATIATGAQDYGVLVYTLPDTAKIIKSAYMSMALDSVAADIASDTPEVGVGTVIASGTQGTLASGTDDDIIAGQAANDCNGTAEVKTIGNQILVIEKGATRTVHFNFAATWTSAGDTNCVIEGTIILEWISFE